MSFLDKAKAKLTDAVDQHGDKIADGIDKAAAAADKKTGGKYADKIATGTDKAKQALDNLDGKTDDMRAEAVEDQKPTPPAPPHATPPGTSPAPGTQP